MEENKAVRAKQEYNEAVEHGKKANHNAERARDVSEKYQKENKRLEEWKRYIPTSKATIFLIFFIAICIVEYLISKNLYREFNADSPWIVAIVLFLIGVLLSEALAYRLVSGKLDWYKELLRNKYQGEKTKDQIEKKAKTFMWLSFIIGVIGTIGFLYFIYDLSYNRVQFEINAGMKQSDFGIMDLLPVIAYFFEIVSGLLVIYLIMRAFKGIRVWSFNKQFDRLVLSCSNSTSSCVDKFDDAEKEGFDSLRANISHEISQAFYRKRRLDVSKKGEYVSELKDMGDEFNLIITDDQQQPIIREIEVITEYKLTGSAQSSADGSVKITFESTYPGDAVKEIRIKKNANDTNTEVVNKVFDLGDTVHKFSVKA